MKSIETHARTFFKVIIFSISSVSCADLYKFPWPNYASVGANFHGTPVVCGTVDSQQTCFKYTGWPDGWQQFASLKGKRHNAAGLMHESKFHVFGGWDWDSSSSQKTTELISIDGGVEDGPELPERVDGHAITSIDSTLSLLSGGATDNGPSSPLTWYFNHETNVFSSGPSLLESRKSHGSATVVDKVTKTKIPMVTGGFGNSGRLDSTELLINGIWQSGAVQCPKIVTPHCRFLVPGNTQKILT